MVGQQIVIVQQANASSRASLVHWQYTQWHVQQGAFQQEPAITCNYKSDLFTECLIKW